ncbi:acyl-coenzyme A thioesterase 8 isoform X2 [Ailuropoda melanoleuca]|uniref:acyl-coenzyme A thioesterase 8 isoform X2 n=1 Tax=Ailuropoda melanoleuca TaxID=9646 RepID=UPI001493E3D7|nr:acyl-coenzyme A thioesterase 8 isoform X2 [Ailuropoda melanoleuca]
MNHMSSRQAPEDEQGGGDPPGDLRSVLVTSVLSLEPLDEDLFRGRHYWVPTTQRLFGGQIVGQALVAAAKSVSEDIHVHSLHCYFVRAGDPKVPVLYQVERTRTGTSFSVRSVKAVQHGKPIFICQASFQQAQPSPVRHQFSMPSVPPPEELLDHKALIDQYLRDPNLQEKYLLGLNRIAAKEVPIEIKPIKPPTLSQPQSLEAKQMFWVRAQGHIGSPSLPTSPQVLSCKAQGPRADGARTRCRGGRHEDALLRGCLHLRLCLPGHSDAAPPLAAPGALHGLPGPLHVVPHPLPS